MGTCWKRVKFLECLIRLAQRAPSDVFAQLGELDTVDRMVHLRWQLWGRLPHEPARGEV